MSNKVGFSQLQIDSDSDSDEDSVLSGISGSQMSHVSEGDNSSKQYPASSASSYQSGSLHSGVVSENSLAFSNGSRGGSSFISRQSSGGSTRQNFVPSFNQPDNSKSFGQSSNAIRIEALQNDIDSKTKTIEELQYRVSFLEDQVSDFKSQIRNRDDYIRKMEDDAYHKDPDDPTKEDMDELCELLHERDTRISKLEGDLYSTEQSRSRIQEESRNHMKKATALEQELAALEKHMSKREEELKQTIAEKSDIVESLEDRLYSEKNVPEQYDSLLSDIKELRVKIRTAEAHRDSKEMMNDRLRKQLQDLSGNDERLRDVIAQKMREISVRNERIEELEDSCRVLQSQVEEMKDPQLVIRGLESSLNATKEELSSVQSKTNQEIKTWGSTVSELKDQISLMNLELDDQQRIIDAYAAEEDIITLANCLKQLRLRDKNFYDFFMAIVMWESNPELPTPDRGVVMDIKDVIRLAEKGLLSLRIVNKCQKRREEGFYLRHPPNLYGKPLWSDSAAHSPLKKSQQSKSSSKAPPDLSAEKIKQENCDSAVRLLDFMDQHQVMEVAKYMCATPLLTEWASTQSTPSSKSKTKPTRPARCTTPRRKPAVPEPNDGECVCFTIFKDSEQMEEKWMEFTDKSSGCQYYHNPKTGVTQWDFPVKVDRNT